MPQSRTTNLSRLTENYIQSLCTDVIAVIGLLVTFASAMKFIVIYCRYTSILFLQHRGYVMEKLTDNSLSQLFCESILYSYIIFIILRRSVTHRFSAVVLALMNRRHSHFIFNLAISSGDCKFTASSLHAGLVIQVKNILNMRSSIF